MFCGRNDPWIGEAYGVSHDDYDDDADDDDYLWESTWGGSYWVHCNS